MASFNEIYGWTLDRCNEELGAAGHYSLHSDVTEAREAVVAMAREMGTLPKKEIRIAKRFGKYVVESKDSKGQWVLSEPGQCSFDDRDDAQDYVDGWLSNGGMVQVSDFEWFC